MPDNTRPLFAGDYRMRHLPIIDADPRRTIHHEHPLAPARGILLGVALGVLSWTAIGIALWLVWRVF